MPADVTASRPAVELRERLDDGTARQVGRLVAAAAAVDGAGALDEQATLGLRAEGVRHLLIPDGPELAGYAQVDGPGGALVVHPEHRRRGYGARLARAAAATSGGELRVWAHGDLPAARGLATALGWTAARRLLQLGRSLTAEGGELAEPALPDGVTLRSFRPGADDEAWLAVNAAAFADHPEQGRWTAADLAARTAEPWFDPAGFLLAERDGELVGFHWTKVHPVSDNDRGGAGEDGKGEGEVYVLGVAPAGQGGGLGRALTLAGLHHLRGLGLPSVLLYVDDANAAAVAVYRRLGFTERSVDVLYRSQPEHPA